MCEIDEKVFCPKTTPPLADSQDSDAKTLVDALKRVNKESLAPEANNHEIPLPPIPTAVEQLEDAYRLIEEMREMFNRVKSSRDYYCRKYAAEFDYSLDLLKKKHKLEDTIALLYLGSAILACYGFVVTLQLVHG